MPSTRRFTQSISAAIGTGVLVAAGLGIIAPASATSCSGTEGVDFTTSSDLQTFLTTQAGICSADGDTIAVTFSSDTIRGGVFAISSMLTYSGPADLVLAGNPLAATTLDGGSSVSILYSGSATAQVTINDLVLTHGAGSRGAGEIYGNLVANDSTFTLNTSTSYGMRVRGGNGATAVSLDNVAFTLNTAASSGAALRVEAGDFVAVDSIFTQNTVTGSGKNGGAVDVFNGDVDISGTWFGQNAASGGGNSTGGALSIDGVGKGGSIVNSAFVGNSTSGSGSGGGVRVGTGVNTLAVANSTFAGNIAAGSGGGISSGGTVDIRFSTFSENDAQASGQISGQVAAQTLNSTGNIFTSTTGETCVAITVNSSYTIATTGDQFCAQGTGDLITTRSALDLGTLATYGPSHTSAFEPAGTSVAVGFVPSSVAAGLTPAVTDDQGGYTRAGAWFTAGSVQIDCPDEPTSVFATPGVGSARIDLTAPTYTGGQSVDNYEYSLDGGAWTPASPTTTASPITISGLTGGQTYSVRVRALITADPARYTPGSIAGRSSTAVTVTPTSAGQPPTVVRNLRATTSDPSRGKVTLAWTAPSNAGAYPVTRYTVRVRMAPSADYVTAKRTSALSTTLTGLVRGRTYYIRVRATNATGNGPSALLKLRF